MKIVPILLLAAPWMLAACDDPASYHTAEPAQIAEDADDADDADEPADDAAPAALRDSPEDPQEGLLCIVCILGGNHPTCGADGQSHPNACFANCEGGGAVPAGDYWPDDDGDGFGDESTSPTSACASPPGMVANGDDCDDSEGATFPGQTEACDGVDNDCNPASQCLPARCSDVRQEDPSAGDGDYTLYVDHAPTQPWAAYCHDMASTQADYLPLVALAEGRNFSQYTASSATPGTDLRTRFSRVRIDPVTFAVEFDDVTFSSSTGGIQHGGFLYTQMPYGVASGCNSADPDDGVANIDLTGTPFHILDNFCTLGTNAQGGAVLSEDDQVADITGGGFCGWTSPGCTFNPHERNNPTVLQLAYVAP